MTLDEAIKHAEEVAEENQTIVDDCVHYGFNTAEKCGKCAEEHRQLAKWLKELKQLREQNVWIPVKFRPLTEEEQEEYPDYCCMADCLMPNDGEEILVSTKHGTVEKDECVFDNGYSLDSGYDWQTDIVAWMLLPEPYREDGE